MRLALLFLLVGFSSLAAQAESIRNPDQITVFFPKLSGEENLGRNVTTVLSLQLAQTGRQRPWPNNPQRHDFGTSSLVWSDLELANPTHSGADTEARNLDLLAQIVVWGSTRKYAGDVIADVNVTLPLYGPAPVLACRKSGLPCDFRQKNFEQWSVEWGGKSLSVGPPRRRFGLSTIQLRKDVVDNFREAKGLPIRADRNGGRFLGRTGTDMLFIEFNNGLLGAPTKVQSDGVTGYVLLPELTEGVSEYADMVGGILQIYRGDWGAAEASFQRVVRSPATRVPLRLDALLYQGMAAFRGGGDGMDLFLKAQEIAPFDRRVVQYSVVGYLKRGGDNNWEEARDLLSRQRHLFDVHDPWLVRANEIFNTK